MSIIAESFVQPSSDRTFWLLMPTVSIAAYAIVLQLSLVACFCLTPILTQYHEVMNPNLAR
jgi:hypothetical protein